jgi:hypothetical protein
MSARLPVKGFALDIPVPVVKALMCGFCSLLGEGAFIALVGKE